ncbi:MAG: AAA family ATPase [Candidatus Micrarchaeota archaeon]|nr:AAA family ATPase [Candidatus Micrarchaeota archaeon]
MKTKTGGSRMDLVYIYGPPGVGKFTVGKELSRMTGYKLFHNQLSIEFVRSVFEFGTEPFNRLVINYRKEMIEEAARNKVSLIFTSAYASGYNDEFMKGVIRSVEKHGGKVHFVQLYCDKDVLLRRVRGKSRTEFYKIRSSRKLDELLHKYNHMSTIPFRSSLFVDNTSITPRQAAMKIASYYKLKKVRK